MSQDKFSYEPYKNGFIIADYSSAMPRFAGVDMVWRNQPIIDTPFETKEQAKEAAFNL